MGGEQSIKEESYFVDEEGEAKQGQTKTIRNINIPKGQDLPYCWDINIQTGYDIFEHSWLKYKHGPYLGTRQRLPNGNYGRYSFRTYDEIRNDIINLGRGIVALNLCKENSADVESRIRMMGIYSKNRPEWLISALACWRNSIVDVALYDTLGTQAMTHILKQTQLSAMVVEGSKIENILKLKAESQAEYLEYIICMDTIDLEMKERAEEIGIKIYHFGEVMMIGRQNQDNLEPIFPKSDTIATVLYTSGTTGNPKGVTMTHKNITAQVSSFIHSGYFKEFRNNSVYLSYLPLAHLYEKDVSMIATANGMQIGFYHGDMLKIPDDAAELKVNIFTAVPRIFNRFYVIMQGKISETKGFKRKLIDRAVKVKLENVRKNNKVTHPLYDALVFSKFKKILGGKLSLISSGAAPVSGEVLEFLKITMSAKVVEIYGISEAGPVCMTTIDDLDGNNVGPPMASCEAKLIDIPEMDYFSTDVIEDKPVPRGEICIRGATVMARYFREPELTREVLDPDGWYHTGDVGQIISKGRIKIIDRKKNIFKLAQAEYVAPDKIENVLSKCKYVSQIFVYGDSLQYYLVAILVPDPQALATWAANNGLEGTKYEDLCENVELNMEIVKDLERVGRASNLVGFEIIKKIYMTPIPFSIEQEILTPTLKVKRYNARKYFQDKLNALYAESLQPTC